MRERACLLWAVVLVSLGCASKGPTTVRGGVYSQPEIAMEDLEEKIEIADRRQELLTSGFLRAGVTVRSTTRHAVRIESRFRWFDAEGFAVGDDSSFWKPVEIPPGDTIEVEGIAPSKKAVRYVLSLRAENPYVKK